MDPVRFIGFKGPKMNVLQESAKSEEKYRTSSCDLQGDPTTQKFFHFVCSDLKVRPEQLPIFIENAGLWSFCFAGSRGIWIYGDCRQKQKCGQDNAGRSSFISTFIAA